MLLAVVVVFFAAILSSASATSWAAPGSAADSPAAFPSVEGHWDAPGPYPVTVTRVKATYSPLFSHTIYHPRDLGRDGVRHPVILWGNGTFRTPLVYGDLLEHWASHGFVVVAANTTQPGSGRQMLRGATYVIDENDREGSIFYQKISVTRIGATGHSQGGKAAINAGADPRVGTTVPLQPLSEDVDPLHGPTFILAGENDTLTKPERVALPLYDEAEHIVAVYGERAGADHNEPFGHGGDYRGAMTAWFRFWLMSDEQARGEFFGPARTCGICTDPSWSDVRRNAQAVAVPGPA